LPYGLALAKDGVKACETNPGLKEGLNVQGGHIVNKVVADSLHFA
jgi:alanine dehydrogenase